MLSTTPVVGKEIPWGDINGQVCHVLDFLPYGRIEQDKALSLFPMFPYASLLVELEKPHRQATLNIFHKIDFVNLSQAYKQKNDEDEMLIIWTTKRYKNVIYKLMSAIMPKLIVWLCKKDSYRLMTDNEYKPELNGEARYIAKKPLLELKPDTMD